MSILIGKIQDFRQKNARELQLNKHVIECYLALSVNLNLLEKAQRESEKALTVAWQHKQYKDVIEEMILLSNTQDSYDREQIKIPVKEVRKLLVKIAQVICDENQEKNREVYEKIPEMIRKMATREIN